jgi:hypothetical protein
MRLVLHLDDRRRLTVVVEADEEAPETIETTGVELKPGLARCEPKRRDSGVVELSTRRRTA